MLKFDKRYAEYLAIVEEEILKIVNSFHMEQPVFEAMRYSLCLQGKRIRPVLALAAADMLKVPDERILPFAVAIEMIHTYSLIHDDLPAMDNDDLRRGHPSCHIKFGEGQAILAGDGLLNQALLICMNNVSDEQTLKACKIIADNAGINGMVGGQSADLKCENTKTASEKELLYIIENKTAKLIQTPLLCASALAGGKYYKELSAYGKAIGYLFQISDDILDVEGEAETIGKSIGKDANEDKLTSVKFYGLNGAKDYAKKYYEEAKGIIKKLPHSDFLSQFTDNIYKRTH